MGWRHLLFLGTLGLFRAATSQAYPTQMDFNGKLLRWDRNLDNPVVHYEVVADAEDDFNRFYGYVLMAGDLWSEVKGSYIRLEPKEEGSVPEITVKLTRSFSGGDQSSGFATFDDSDNDGPIHCQIEIAIVDNLSTYSFAKTVLHELGHCVGLGHTLLPKAIMSYYLSENEFKLDTDDTAAVARLYPASGETPKLPPGCAISQVGGDRNAIALCFLLAWPGLFWALRSLTRRRKLA